jgi:hypothetical protein
VACADQYPIRPALDEVRIAQARQVSPDTEERHLEHIAGGVEVTQDPMRDREQAVAQLEREAGECLSIASLRPLHQGPIHRCLLWQSRSTPLSAMASPGVESVRSCALMGWLFWVAIKGFRSGS